MWRRVTQRGPGNPPNEVRLVGRMAGNRRSISSAGSGEFGRKESQSKDEGWGEGDRVGDQGWWVEDGGEGWWRGGDQGSWRLRWWSGWDLGVVLEMDVSGDVSAPSSWGI